MAFYNIVRDQRAELTRHGKFGPSLGRSQLRVASFFLRILLGRVSSFLNLRAHGVLVRHQRKGIKVSVRVVEKHTQLLSPYPPIHLPPAMYDKKGMASYNLGRRGMNV